MIRWWTKDIQKTHKIRAAQLEIDTNYCFSYMFHKYIVLRSCSLNVIIWNMSAYMSQLRLLLINHSVFSVSMFGNDKNTSVNTYGEHFFVEFVFNESLRRIKNNMKLYFIRCFCY